MGVCGVGGVRGGEVGLLIASPWYSLGVSVAQPGNGHSTASEWAWHSLGMTIAQSGNGHSTAWKWAWHSLGMGMHILGV